MKKNEIHRYVLKEMKGIFYPKGARYIDWMGYPITNENKPSYHHIKKVEELKRDNYDSKATVENGAILGKRSHEILHHLEYEDYELYECWNYLFRVINDMRTYPIDDVWCMVNKLKNRTNDVLNSKGKTLKLSKKQ